MKSAPKPRRSSNLDVSAVLKVWLVFATALAAGLLAAHLIGWNIGGGASLVKRLWTLEAARLAETVERGLVRDAVESLASDRPERWSTPDAARDALQAWMTNRAGVAVAEYWSDADPLPVRIVNDSLVAAIEADSMDDSTRSALRRFLYPEAFPLTLKHKKPYVSAWFSLPNGRMPLTAVAVPVGFDTAARPSIVLIRFGLDGADPLIRRIAVPDETVTLNDASGQILDRVSAASPTGGPSLRVRAPMRLLPWTIEIEKPVPPGLVPQGGFAGVAAWLLGLVLFSLVSAAFTAWWLERPIRTLSSAAFEIGRGNFSLRLPQQKNRFMNRLARLINYMVEEMDHLQRMNVSAIVHEKDKTEAVLRNLADGVLVIDPFGRVAMLNRSAENWLGLKEEDAVGKPFRECVRHRPLAALLQDIHDGGTETSSEFSVRHPDTRKTRHLFAQATRAVGRDGRGMGTVAVLRDVTAEKEADRLKNELVSMVAHELKSPLTSIYGFSELLMESEPRNRKAHEYAAVIQAEAGRLTEFVNKFLRLSRLESGRVKIKMDPFDLRPVIEKAFGLLNAQAEKKHVLLVLQIPESLPLVAGDPELIEQVVLNLASNAVKYSPNRSKVGVEVGVAGKEVVINVIDNGYGIPKEALPRIFDKFYRVPEMKEGEESEGSGLGLALVKEIVEKHGGTIRVKSKVGVGSVFSFSLHKADLKGGT
jgi:two-component system, OmpR family, phosphate regulon sensor histidine kinase PhoR